METEQKSVIHPARAVVFSAFPISDSFSIFPFIYPSLYFSLHLSLPLLCPPTPKTVTETMLRPQRCHATQSAPRGYNAASISDGGRAARKPDAQIPSTARQASDAAEPSRVAVTPRVDLLLRHRLSVTALYRHVMTLRLVIVTYITWLHY